MKITKGNHLPNHYILVENATIFAPTSSFMGERKLENIVELVVAA
jgi:hypothetical protein